MFIHTKIIMLSVLLAASNAAARGLTAIPIVTTNPAGASSSSAASTVSYYTPTAPTNTGYPGRPDPFIGGAFPSGAPNGQSGGNPLAHGGPYVFGGPTPSETSQSGSLGGGFPYGHGYSQNVARQNNNHFPGSGSGQSSDITTADNSTFLPYIIAYYTPPFDVRGLSTVRNTTQGQDLVEFITENGGERDGDWWKVSTADFVYHIQSYTTTIGGTVFNITAAGVPA